MKDFYEILNSSRSASQAEIRANYRLLVSKCHPDRFKDQAEKARAEERIKEVNEAYEVLGNPAKRKRYDRKRFPSQRRSRPAESGALDGSSTRRTRRTANFWGFNPDRFNNPHSVDPAEPPAAPNASPSSAPPHQAYRFSAFAGDRVEIHLSQAANVLLLDEINYRRYLRNMSFHYIGGFAQSSPLILLVPASGAWRLVIDRGGLASPSEAQVRLLRFAHW